MKPRKVERRARAAVRSGRSSPGGGAPSSDPDHRGWRRSRALEPAGRSRVADTDAFPVTGEIASQLVSSGVDVLMGDGLGYFDGTRRADSQDLLAGLPRPCTIVRSPEELARVDATATSALLGLFAISIAPALDPAKPRLATMTETALVILARDPDGFFLLVETEGSDEAAHANAPIEELAAIKADLDSAIHVALRFRERHPETLIVMTADHETGGAALHVGRGGVPSLSYTTGGHGDNSSALRGRAGSRPLRGPPRW